MNEFAPRPLPEAFTQTAAQLSNTQLRVARVRETARIIVSDAGQALKEDWARSLNQAQALLQIFLGLPTIPYHEEEVDPTDEEARDRLHVVLAEMTRRRVIRQE